MMAIPAARMREGMMCWLFMMCEGFVFCFFVFVFLSAKVVFFCWDMWYYLFLIAGFSLNFSNFAFVNCIVSLYGFV